MGEAGRKLLLLGRQTLAQSKPEGGSAHHLSSSKQLPHTAASASPGCRGKAVIRSPRHHGRAAALGGAQSPLAAPLHARWRGWTPRLAGSGNAEALQQFFLFPSMRDGVGIAQPAGCCQQRLLLELLPRDAGGTPRDRFQSLCLEEPEAHVRGSPAWKIRSYPCGWSCLHSCFSPHPAQKCP